MKATPLNTVTEELNEHIHEGFDRPSGSLDIKDNWYSNGLQ